MGKERIARLIHDESARMGGPFVAIDCGALPERMLEAELFGHAKRAFTGATQDRPGLFEAANGGTLLLDEIGEMPPLMQVKLLRTLQQREVRRIGENKNRKVDARVLAAPHRDLPAEVHAARFRSINQAATMGSRWAVRGISKIATKPCADTAAAIRTAPSVS